MSKKPARMNSIDIARPYIEAMAASDMPRIQLLGGVGSAALLHPETVIDTESKVIRAPGSLYLENYRKDGNLRDIETLVMSSRPVDTESTEACVEANIKGGLITEVFDIKDEEGLARVLARPLGLRAMAMFLSDRYLPSQMEYFDDGPQPRRILVPFAVSMARAALETWTLEVGDDLEIPVPSPGATVVNYLTRSISGLRAKDAKKVEMMSGAIFDKAPETVDWIIDGPGGSQFELARILHTLRESRQNPRQLVVGGRLEINPMTGARLEEHPAFMFPDLDTETQRKIIQLAKVKSRGLHGAESFGGLVTVFQRHIEPLMRSIVHNR